MASDTNTIRASGEIPARQTNQIRQQALRQVRRAARAAQPEVLTDDAFWEGCGRRR